MKSGLRTFISVFFLILADNNGLAQTGAHSGSLNVHFVFQFHGEPIEPDKMYETAAGDSVRVEQIRFYTGNLYALQAGDMPPQRKPLLRYHLVDSKDSASLSVPAGVSTPGSLTGVEFSLGVDSIDQVSGARSGALDPLNGMYWTWNSGYVAVKIEGRSPSSQAGGQVEYHLGGYRGPDAVRTFVRLLFKEPFTIAAGEMANLTIPVELERFFPKSFSIKKMPAFMTPGPVAKQLMQQFKTCFGPVVNIKSGL